MFTINNSRICTAFAYFDSGRRLASKFILNQTHVTIGDKNRLKIHSHFATGTYEPVSLPMNFATGTLKPVLLPTNSATGTSEMFL